MCDPRVRSTDLLDQGRSYSEGALRGEKVGMEVDSIGRDVLEGLMRSLVGSCGQGRGDNATRIPHCVRMSC